MPEGKEPGAAPGSDRPAPTDVGSKRQDAGVPEWNAEASRRAEAGAGEKAAAAEGRGKPETSAAGTTGERAVAAARKMKEQGIHGKPLEEKAEKPLEWYNGLDKNIRFQSHRGDNRSDGLSELWTAAGRPNQQGRNWCGCFVNVALKDAGVTDGKLLAAVFGGPSAIRFAASHPERAVDLRGKTAGEAKAMFSEGAVRPGDVVVFSKRGHVGLVEAVDTTSGKLRTIEGNTWKADGISRVLAKEYPLGGKQLKDTVFIRPEPRPHAVAAEAH